MDRKRIKDLISDLSSKNVLPDKPKKMASKESFVKLAKEVKKIFDAEESERRNSTPIAI